MEPLEELKEYNSIMQDLTLNETPIHVAGCIDTQKCHLISGVGRKYKWKLIVTYNDLKAKEIYDDYKLYSKNVWLYPAKDVIFYSADIRGNAIVKERLIVLKQLIEGNEGTIVTTIDAGLDRILPLDYITNRVITIKVSQTIHLDSLRNELVHLGYERCGQVGGPGEFAIRGGIIDIFPLTEECPYRIELWDDEVDTIRIFDISSQRSIENVEEMNIYPAAEIVLDEATIQQGIDRLDKETKEYVQALRSQMKTEEAHRIRQIVEEFKENLEAYNGSLGIDSYIKYFYSNTVSIFDYFKQDDAVIFHIGRAHV